MTPRQRKIVDLLAKGHSVIAIASLVGSSENAVRLILSRLGMSTVAVPPGHVGIREAARRVRMEASKLYRAIRRGELRHVQSRSRRYVTMEWVHIWIQNDPYRVWAREMAQRVFSRLAAMRRQASGS